MANNHSNRISPLVNHNAYDLNNLTVLDFLQLFGPDVADQVVREILLEHTAGRTFPRPTPNMDMTRRVPARRRSGARPRDQVRKWCLSDLF